MGESDRLQRRAIASWKALPIRSQIILCGDDSGVREACAELGLEHIAEVPKNNLGTFYLNDALSLAISRALSETICFVNADIILLPRMVNALRACQERFSSQTGKEGFLLVGSRWDFDLDNGEFSEQVALSNGRLHPPHGSDIFVFPKSVPVDMPPFLIGRPYWDLWMFSYFRRLKLPVIDMTEYCLLFHQNHGYGHILMGTGHKWHGVEGAENKKYYQLCGCQYFYTNLRDATHRATRAGVIKRRLHPRALLFGLSESLVFHVGLFIWYALRDTFSALRVVDWAVVLLATVGVLGALNAADTSVSLVILLLVAVILLQGMILRSSSARCESANCPGRKRGQ